MFLCLLLFSLLPLSLFCRWSFFSLLRLDLTQFGESILLTTKSNRIKSNQLRKGKGREGKESKKVTNNPSQTQVWSDHRRNGKDGADTRSDVGGVILPSPAVQDLKDWISLDSVFGEWTNPTQPTQLNQTDGLVGWIINHVLIRKIWHYQRGR